MLTEYLEKAKKGELQSLILGFVRVDGGAAVQSTPMSPVMMNHLSTLLERRVAREYDRALAQANNARVGTGAGAVPETSRQSPAAKLPRKVRRAVQQRQKALQELAAKKEKKRAKQAQQPPVIRRPPEPAN
jgi:hypothetical protein